MASVNKVILLGYLGRDPELRYSPDNQAVANVSIATSDVWKDKNGGKQEKTEWHRVVFFSRLAEIAGQYLKKGSQVYIEGRLQSRKWQDKEGQERTITEVVAEKMQMIGGGSRSGASSDYSSEREAGEAPYTPTPYPENNAKSFSSFESLVDDIPF